MSLPTPPPPPGDELYPSHNDILPPSPADFAIPPPGTEVHENDVLKRKNAFSWRRFGGDGFLISVAFHVILLLLALFYVIKKYTEPKKPDTEVFATGAGGGANGDKAKQFEHKMQRKMTTPLKSPSRIVSKSANAAVALPTTPTTSTASFASGLSAGGMSKGSGGGSGGGEGTGIGIGKGGGRNFVSLFGAIGANAPGLPGTFYDMKQTPDGKPTAYTDASSVVAFTNDVLRAHIKTWSTTSWDSKFFKSPEQLATSTVFIPAQNANAAPKAYQVGDKVAPSRWVAIYRGTVTAPKTGKFRFWGLGDDTLLVRFNGKICLDSGWTILTEGSGSANFTHVKSVLGQTETKKGRPGAPFRAGTWISVDKGRDYPIEILISEIPGGSFGAWVMMEEGDADKMNKGDGQLFLFRMSAEALPEELHDDTGLGVDLTGKNLIWKAKGAKNLVR